MALDGLFLRNLIEELKLIENSHIDKIHQPSKDELVLLLRKPKFSERLYISAKSGIARLHLTEQKFENPDTPPMFCMLLRKHLGNARIDEISQFSLERVTQIKTTATNEMGDTVNPRLIIELISGSPNIILLDNEGRIYDALRRSNIEVGGRLIQPGAIYELPDKKERLNILSTSAAKITEAVFSSNEKNLDSAILSTLEGLSPLIAREICFRATKTVDFPLENLTTYHKNMLTKELAAIKAELSTGAHPTVLCDNSNNFTEFSFTEIKQYGTLYQNKSFEGYSMLLDTFYQKRTESERLRQASLDILKLLSLIESRIKRRMALRERDLEKCLNREHLRIYGELIKANLHSISLGQTKASVVNYYDENMATVSIPLNPALSPAANAAKYFKDYKKSHTAEQTLSSLIETDKNELTYIQSVLESLSRAKTTADIDEIRTELASVGLIKQKQNTKAKKVNTNFEEFVSPSGLPVLMGRNNTQNDDLTLHTAAKTDIWFHTKNIPGAHVVLCTDGSHTDEDILFAATLAAKNSKAAASSQVAVDYTPIKFIKKPNGAKPGMVIYSTNQTVYVTP